MTHFHHFVPRYRRRHRTCCIRRPTLCYSAKRIAVCPSGRITSSHTRSTQKENDTVSTKLPRHTVPKVVGTSAHCVICILKRGRYFVLAQEPLRQISVSSPLNVLNAESSSTLVSLSCKKHGNVAILLKNGNSHGFSQGKELDQRNAALPLHRLHYSENENGWHISLRPAVKVAALVHRWTHLKQTTLTRRIGHALLNDVCEDVWHERIFRKAPPAWSFPGAPLRLLVDSNTFPGRQCHGIGFEQRATHSSVFDEVFRALVWHVCFTKNTSKLPRVSRFHFVQELQQVRHFWIAVGTHSRYSKESVLLLTTLETGFPQLATRLCKRILPASTQRTSNCSKWHTAGEIQISQEESHGKHSTTSPIPSLVVVKNLRRLWLMWCEGKYKTSQHKNTFERLAGAQLRLDCVDGQRGAKIGSGTLPGDRVAGGWFLLHLHPKLDAFSHTTPELQINATLLWAIPNAPEALDVGTSTHADDITREIRDVCRECHRRNQSLQRNSQICSGTRLCSKQQQTKDPSSPRSSRVTRRVSNHSW